MLFKPDINTLETKKPDISIWLDFFKKIIMEIKKQKLPIMNDKQKIL